MSTISISDETLDKLLERRRLDADRIRALEVELARCRAANVYDGEAHRKVSALEADLTACKAERDSQVLAYGKVLSANADLRAELAKYQYPPEHRVTVAEARSSALEAALSSLRNETRGIIGAFELEVRPAIGNTNWSCLFRRLDQADELLTASETKGEQG